MPRPTFTDINAMKFWNGILPEAMKKFSSETIEPKGLSKAGYTIRDKTDWNDVYIVLEGARNKYQKEGGRVGSLLRKVRRKFADNVTPIAAASKIASKLAPDNPYSTPVLGAVEILFDAFKTAANVRKEVFESFDDLVPIFSDVEIFLTMFSGDENIRNASIDLTATTLDAIEHAICFFISNGFLRGGKALLNGSDYQSPLLQSLTKIKTKSTVLKDEAAKSHMYQVYIHTQEIQKDVRRIPELQEHLKNIMKLAKSTNDIVSEHKWYWNCKCLYPYSHNILSQVVASEIQSAAPNPGTTTIGPPIMDPIINMRHGELLYIFSRETPPYDVHDLDFLNNNRVHFLVAEQARVESIVGQQSWRNWMAPASGTKLLVHWNIGDRPRSWGNYTVLSTLTGIMAKHLQRVQDHRFIVLVWFCGRHCGDPADIDNGPRAMITSFVEQLLRRVPVELNLQGLENHVNLTFPLQRWDVRSLLTLLEVLVRILPPTITVMCMVDGVSFYERELFVADALMAFDALDYFTTLFGHGMGPRVKLLLTSSPGTMIIRESFFPWQQQDIFLEVSTVRIRNSTPSDERMIRESGLSEYY
ncbi:hypothetical protein QBC46DRAFT_264256 [Diplogelasinospora grovesii]|uniref:Uncharacterized protein n=1 Tax=Diplogelasinospora grovesii TaxID=303347 RepID=A0AAN6N4J9_9PEZI|nr:hypothetical protein QBC46DRAFT_264256 [Diplogelasinospora grovesii]